MTTLNNLMNKLYKIETDCNPNASKPEKQEKLDDFSTLKKKISQEVKSVRKMIEERNQLLSGSEQNSETVKMSAEIRKALKETEKDAKELEVLQKEQEEKLQKKKDKGKEVSSADEQEVSMRHELVELAYQHIEECHTLEKSVYKNISSENFVGLMNPNDIVPTSLPDLEDERFLLLRTKDAEIDRELDEISKGVNILGQMANQIGQETTIQGLMIEEVEHGVDKANEHLNTLNKTLKGILQKYRKGDRFCIDFILIVLLLGIAGYLYSTITHTG